MILTEFSQLTIQIYLNFKAYCDMVEIVYCFRVSTNKEILVNVQCCNHIVGGKSLRIGHWNTHSDH